jgi:phage gp46-like protein
MPDFSDYDFPALPPTKMELIRNRTTMVGNAGRPVATGPFATINDLPDELHLNILHYLLGIELEDFRLASLISLSRTNRRFRRLVTEKIYASYDSHLCEPYLFLRTVISNTYLASLVKYVDFTYGEFPRPERQRYTANAQDKKVIKEGLKGLGISDWKNIATKCNTDLVELDILHTAILMQIPNIYSLVIRVSGSGSHEWIDLIRKANLGASDLGRMHRFKHLQTLRVETNEIALIALAPIFRTPSLRKLYLKGFYEYESVQHRAAQTQALQDIIPQRCNYLEELHIEYGFFHNNTLRVVLASTQNLKAFSYDCSTDYLYHDLIEEADLGSTTLVAALKCHQTVLESLSYIDDEVENAEELELMYNLNHLSNGLRDFSALKHLSCSLGSMLDKNSKEDLALVEKLPPSLISLHITIAQRFTDNQAMEIVLEFVQLASNYGTRTPLLSKVHVNASPYYRFDWSRVVAAFSKTDINFTVEQSSWDGSWSESSFHGFIQATGRPSSDTESSESSGEVSLYSN